MNKVIFIPGFLRKTGAPAPLKRVLGKNFEVIDFVYDTSGRTKIEVLAKRLKKFIDKIHLEKEEKINIIAFSMGGLIASYYSKFIDNKKISKLITVATPFRGSHWATRFFSKRNAIKQMRPRSFFLKRLNKKKFTRIKQESFWDKYDLIVGGSSAKYGHSKRFNFFLHPFASYWPPLINRIEKELERS